MASLRAYAVSSSLRPTQNWQAPCSSFLPDRNITLKKNQERNACASRFRTAEGPRFSRPQRAGVSFASGVEATSADHDGAAFSGGFKGDETVASVMTSMVVVATPETKLGDILEHFAFYTGLPVVDERSMELTGMIANIDLYKKQRGKAESVATTPVKDVMVSPVVAVFPYTVVSYAAGLMLKYKVHRLPVIDRERRVVGIVTNKDLFRTLTASDKPDSKNFAMVP